MVGYAGGHRPKEDGGVCFILKHLQNGRHPSGGPSNSPAQEFSGSADKLEIIRKMLQLHPVHTGRLSHVQTRECGLSDSEVERLKWTGQLAAKNTRHARHARHAPSHPSAFAEAKCDFKWQGLARRSQVELTGSTTIPRANW